MEHLDSLRNDIDRLDAALIDILARPFCVTREIGQWKKLNNLPPVDVQREEQQTQKIKDLGNTLGLGEAVTLKVLRAIIDEVVEDHKKA